MSGVLSVLAAGGGVRVTLENVTIRDFTSGVGSAGYALLSNGDIESFLQNGSPDTEIIGQWLNQAGLASNFKVRATLLDGSLSVGTVDSWLGLSSDRSWRTTSFAELFIEISIDESTIMASATIFLVVTLI